MLLNSTPSEVAYPAPIVYPDNLVRATLREDYDVDFSGVIWKLQVLVNTITITSQSDPTQIKTYAVPGASEASFAFDLNGNIVLTYVKNNRCFYRWFNSLSAEYQTAEIYGGYSPYAILDERRSFNSQQTDVCLFYLTHQSVCVRYQRERFEVEHAYTPRQIGENRIAYVGMNQNSRIELGLSNF